MFIRILSVSLQCKQNKQKQNIMKIENISNNKGDQTYELTIIGTQSEIDAFENFTSFTTDFVEDEGNDMFSILVMGSMEFSKKEFRADVTNELKELRKKL